MIIEFPAPAPLLNLNQKWHWSKKGPIVAEWRKAAFVHGQQAAFDAAGMKWLDRDTGLMVSQIRPYAPSTVKVTLPVRSLKTRRDPHNFIATVKPIVDGLVDAGFWPDDTADWVTVVEPEFWTGRNVLVEIYPRGQ